MSYQAFNDLAEIRVRARQLANEKTAEEINNLLRDWRRKQRGVGTWEQQQKSDTAGSGEKRRSA
jgi:hypothetical protein